MSDTDTLFLKNVILKTHDIDKVRPLKGMDIIHRKEQNNENYMTLTGTKQQINHYLQDCANNLLSERLRTLNNLPKFRLITTTRLRIQ
jgi:hypothetical protein